MISRNYPHRDKGTRTKVVGTKKERIHFNVKSRG